MRLLEHRIPDVTSTVGLPVRLAAEIDYLAGRVDRWADPDTESMPAISARSLALLGRPADAREVLADIDVETTAIADLAAAAWAASRVGGPTIASLLSRLETGTADFLDEGLPMGPRRLYVGLLHAARGDLDLATDALSDAVAHGDRRAPFWGALCRLELGRVLRTAEAVPIGDPPPSASPLTAARTFFAAGGYRSLLQRVQEADAPVRATFDVGPQTVVGFGVQPSVAIRPSKGLVAIRHLVVNGPRLVPAMELANIVDGRDMPSRRIDAADSSDRLRALYFDDRTRSRVTKLLRRTVSKLTETHRLSGVHLEAAIETGHTCRYRPPGAPVWWETDASRS